MTPEEIASCTDIERLLRHRDQADGMVGLALADGDRADADRLLQEHILITNRVRELRSL